jgi:hypothetical protein
VGGTVIALLNLIIFHQSSFHLPPSIIYFSPLTPPSPHQQCSSTLYHRPPCSKKPQAPQEKKRQRNATQSRNSISIKLLGKRSFRMYVYTERSHPMHATPKIQIPDMPIPSSTQKTPLKTPSQPPRGTKKKKRPAVELN